MSFANFGNFFCHICSLSPFKSQVGLKGPAGPSASFLNLGVGKAKPAEL